jgi:hypothetical protein
MLEKLTDEYACIMECYSNGMHYERGMPRFELAGTDFKHPCFQLVKKADITKVELKEEIPEEPLEEEKEEIPEEPLEEEKEEIPVKPTSKKKA